MNAIGTPHPWQESFVQTKYCIFIPKIVSFLYYNLSQNSLSSLLLLLLFGFEIL